MRVLVVDPSVDPEGIVDEMAVRGVHVTCVSSTVDALIEFGRLRPTAVIVAPEATGLPAADFIRKIREHSPVFVVASLECAESPGAGSMLVAGAAAALTRPYDAEDLWDLVGGLTHGLDDRATVVFGPIELDTRAYTVTVNGERIADLALKEFEMLRALLYSAPEVVSNDDLRSSLWADRDDGPTDNTIAVYVARLRHHLQGSAQIRRVRGRGYSLTVSS